MWKERPWKPEEDQKTVTDQKPDLANSSTANLAGIKVDQERGSTEDNASTRSVATHLSDSPKSTKKLIKGKDLPSSYHCQKPPLPGSRLCISGGNEEKFFSDLSLNKQQEKESKLFLSKKVPNLNSRSSYKEMVINWPKVFKVRLEEEESSMDESNILNRKSNMKAIREDVYEGDLDTVELRALYSVQREGLGYILHFQNQKGWEGTTHWEEMTQKAEFFIRKKDFFLYILSCSMEQREDDNDFTMEQKAGDNDFTFLTRTFFDMKQLRRELAAPPSDYRYALHDEYLSKIREIEHRLQHAERRLARYDFHMVAYLPQEDDKISSGESLERRIAYGLRHRATGTFDAPNEMLTMAINSATRQVSKYIEDGIFLKIGISGSGGDEVARALMDSPTIRVKCGVVVHLSVSKHHSIRKIKQNLEERINKSQQTDDNTSNCLLLIDCIDGLIDLHELVLPRRGFVVLTTETQNVYEIMKVDLEVRMEDHLLPWELFCRNVGRSVVKSSPVLQQMAFQLIKECCCHLLAIILLARALRDVTDLGVWELAHSRLTSQSSTLGQGASKVMKKVLGLIWDQKDFTTKQCIRYCTSVWHNGSGARSLVSGWKNSLVATAAEGKAILEDLVNSFLLENVGKKKVQMRQETKTVLERYFTSSIPSSYYLRKGGRTLTKTPKVEKWNVKEIELENNKLSELPENPKCPALTKLWLQNNYDLMDIPKLFFKEMPLLENLDLSHTSIKSLPSSISRLVSLRKFNLRSCELLRMLPPEIQKLRNLEDFDLEGTELVYLPKEIGELISLRSFKVSLCGCTYHYGETEKVDTTIPAEVLSRFSQLEELSIDVIPDGDWWDGEVNPDSEWWDDAVKAILNELSSSKKLRSLSLYLPSVELLKRLRWDNKKLMCLDLSRFRFTVGRYQQRIIHRLPHEVEERFKNWEEEFKKSLKYINGEGMPPGITEALKHASVFFLDRHWTIKVLSEFGHENMIKLECCLLVECNELQTIIDGGYENLLGVDKKSAFERLRYLSVHYMKNLQSIWQGPIDKKFLSNLRSLALHKCLSLTTIFTPELLGNLRWLEELIVEDCPKVNSLVTQQLLNSKSGLFLRNLKNISLLDLPELVSISGCLIIGELVDSLIVYNCPKLESIYGTEMSPTYFKIKGEKEWWDSLKWHKSDWRRKIQPSYEELRTDEDFMDQLAKDIYSTKSR